MKQKESKLNSEQRIRWELGNSDWREGHGLDMGGHGLDLNMYPISARLAAVLGKLVELCFGCC